MKGTLFVIGGGGHAWVVTEAARAAGWKVLGFFDDDPKAEVDADTPRLGSIPEAAQAAIDDSVPLTVIGIGSLETRARIISEMGGLYAVVVHPSAHISPSSKLGQGTFVGATAVIQGRSVIGDHCIVNTGAIIEHDCILGKNVHVAPRAVLGGGVRIGENTLIGVGASVRPGVKIGRDVIVGVGAAVVRDVPDGSKVVGVPAKPVEWWTEGDGG